MLKILDGSLRVAEVGPRIAAPHPGIRIVGVCAQRLIETGDCFIEPADIVNQRLRIEGQYLRVARIQLHCSLSRPLGFCSLVCGIEAPGKCPSYEVANRLGGIGKSKFGIQRDGLFQQGQRFLRTFPGVAINGCPSPQVVVIGVQVCGLASSPFDLRQFEPRGDGADHLDRDLIL